MWFSFQTFLWRLNLIEAVLGHHGRWASVKLLRNVGLNDLGVNG